MKIIIDYESVWQNSFLTGSNDEPVKKREFKASSKSKEAEDVKEISHNTILGILSRLIGDQRKLYQVKHNDDFYFKDMDISFQHTKHSKTWIEKAFLINKSENRPPQSSFIGVLKEDESLFFSDYSATLWSVLDFSFEELLDFIINPKIRKIEKEVSVSHILNKVQFDIQTMEAVQFFQDKINLVKDKLTQEYKKEKPSDKRIESLNEQILRLEDLSNNENVIKFEKKLKDCLGVLELLFPEESYVEKNNTIYPIRLYSAGLYVMVNELKQGGVDISKYISTSGTIKGFSKRNFNGVRDFLNPLMGNKKKTTHTPYNLTKASGQLEITLDIDLPKAMELKQMIDHAGVSSFYLGKKGLAYVSDIRLK